jgi:hypothetical protein
VAGECIWHPIFDTWDVHHSEPVLQCPFFQVAKVGVADLINGSITSRGR